MFGFISVNNPDIQPSVICKAVTILMSFQEKKQVYLNVLWQILDQEQGSVEHYTEMLLDQIVIYL